MLDIISMLCHHCFIAFEADCALLHVVLLQDIPSIIEAAKAEQADRLSVQAKMRDADNPDTSVVLYLQVGSGHSCRLIASTLALCSKATPLPACVCTLHADLSQK